MPAPTERLWMMVPGGPNAKGGRPSDRISRSSYAKLVRNKRLGVDVLHR
jgi:hypothetical protein